MPVQVVYHEDMGMPMIVRLAHVQVRVIGAEIGMRVRNHVRILSRPEHDR